MELMIVVVIGAIVMVFAIPRYFKTLQISLERQAYEDLTVIWSAVKLYAAINGDYPTESLWGTDEINPAFNVNVIPNGDFSYRCGINVSELGQPYECMILNSNGGWDLHVMRGHQNGEVHCSGSPTCPTCNPLCPY